MKQRGRIPSRDVSIIHRLGQIYFDAALRPYRLGCGQQFFLIRISDEPGISILELAERGLFDKGTTARAVKKLEEEGLIRISTDDKDRRVKRLYPLPGSERVVEETHRAVEQWNTMLTIGMEEEEKVQAENLLERMAQNAYASIKDRKKEHEWNKQKFQRE